MLGNRSIGLRTLSLAGLLLLVSMSFWGWLFFWQNELFYDPKTAMLFGDAKSSLSALITEMKNV